MRRKKVCAQNISILPILEDQLATDLSINLSKVINKYYNYIFRHFKYFQ